MPQITVILPTYNCDHYINECIESLLAQTFEDFELLIIDDASTDQTVSILRSYQDPRIKLKVKEQNTGYTDSLNWGIYAAQGNYIARMDADDICHPQRFAKQVSLLESNPNVDLVGTSAAIINSDVTLAYPRSNENIRTTLLFGNAFVHPSVMGKTDIFKKLGYDKMKEPAEDYDLWTRMAPHYNLTNIPEILLYYRVHEHQVSSVKRNLQDKSARSSMLRMFKILSYDHILYTDPEVENYIWPYRLVSAKDTKKAMDWYASLKDKHCFFDQDLLASSLSRKRYNFLKYYFLHPDQCEKPFDIKFLLLKYYPKLALKLFFKG